ncbi:NAD-dependent epimerase [Hanstruepera neustonica]|uniref:NAD-dependent epimerase n=1 Tax=Hanstruepera neustonica TaxID=1445657 RepID=A0A2K1E471_9FLAO|nr:NAD-dependent epimerase/dehydratase family protein [Hanstruepera neustonica]PNQ75082.1 NAD-dependent epimerase [Hanstruepera neustonica]
MILVTGGTGLVGSHLLYQLVNANDSVRAIYRRPKKLSIVKKVFSYYTDHVDALYDKIDWIDCDLLDVPKLMDVFDGITYVYHCAAFVSFEPDKYHLLRRTNIEGTANIVNLCISNKVKKLCYVSSIAALGESNKNNIINENTTWNADADNSVYAITKYGAEMEVWRGTQEGLPAVIVNPGVIIGGGIWSHGSGNIIKKVYNKIPYYTEGSIGVIDVLDVVNIMISLLNSSIENERFVLVAENISYQTFLNTIANHLNVEQPKKEAKPWLLAIAWRLDWLKNKITGKRRVLVKQMVASLFNSVIYENTKIKEVLSYKFIPFEKSIEKVTQQFLKDY